MVENTEAERLRGAIDVSAPLPWVQMQDRKRQTQDLAFDDTARRVRERDTCRMARRPRNTQPLAPL